MKAGAKSFFDLSGRLLPALLALFIISNAFCSLYGATIAIGVADGIPPYAIASKKAGLQVDIVREIFSSQNYTPEFLFMPHLRMRERFNLHELDVACSAKPPPAEWKGVLSHGPVFTYRNNFITLARKLPQVIDVERLASLRFAAFQGARLYLGQDYVKAISKAPWYREFATFLPTKMLIRERIDGIVSDPNIFRYWVRIQSSRSEEIPEFAYHSIFGPANSYWMVFKSEAIREAFEKGLAHIYKTKAIDRIVEKYKDHYGTDRSHIAILDCRMTGKSDLKDVDCETLLRRF